MSGFAEYDDHDALGLAQLVRRGEVSATELVDECIERIERVNGSLNAVVTPMYERARDAAQQPGEGPFAGVPFLVKDLVASVEGVRFTRGCRFYANDIPDHDSELIRRYRAAGLVLVAKTNTPELGLKPMTEPVLHGPTQNPWRRGRTAGGSSGGSGAMVAARVVPMAHGGDGGGSIRIPASCCGVFGMKPTRGRTPAGPDQSEGWYGFAIEHALSRSVRDNAALLDATASRYDPGAPYAPPAPAGPFADECTRDPGKLRIAVCRGTHLPGQPEPAVMRALDDAAALCSELGHQVDEAEPRIDSVQLASDYLSLVAVAVAVDIDRGATIVGRRATHRDFETNTWNLGLLGRTFDAVTIEAARQRLQAVARDVGRFFGDWDVLLTPTLGQSPPPHGSLDSPPLMARAERVIAAMGLSGLMKLPGLVERVSGQVYNFIPWTPLANITGQPSMSVPLHWSDDDMPQGTMFTGRFGDEATLYRLAAQLEKARPWADRIPPIHACRVAAAEPVVSSGSG